MNISTFLFENESLISEGLTWHFKNSVPLFECVYRWGSNSHIELMSEARALIDSGILDESMLQEKDIWLLKNTDIGKWGIFEGLAVPLDVPFEEQLQEAEYRGKSVELNKPFRSGGGKKFAVYVKNEKGNVIRLGFGQPGMRIKTHSPERVRSFLARHNCDTPGPRWKARWWSCNLHRYKKQLGLNFKGRW